MKQKEKKTVLTLCPSPISRIGRETSRREMTAWSQNEVGKQSKNACSFATVRECQENYYENNQKFDVSSDVHIQLSIFRSSS